ncbi:amidase [Bacteroidota bacterium]
MNRRELLALLGSTAAMSPLAGSLVGKAAASPRVADVAAGRSELHFESLTTVAKLIETREISPVELAQLMLDRIAAVDGRLHSYVTITPELAIENARRAEDEIMAGRYLGPMHGIPIGIKDLCYTRGIRTMAGTVVLSDFVPDFDASVVAKLEASGAISLGKLTLCEGAQAPYHPDLEVPVNPWDATRWSGVSSSGSGVATAAGLCFGSIGTDTGGSIRYPSASNGCVGLKPTYGRVSRHGVFPLAESMDHVGPMTRTVEDAAIMFETMAGFDENDPTSLAEPVEPVSQGLSQGIDGLRIGYDHRYATEGVEPEVAQAVAQVLEELRSLGAEIVEVTMPDVGELAYNWYVLGTVEAAAAHAATFPSRADEYGPGFREDLEFGLQVTGIEFAAATKGRLELAAGVHRMLAGVDCFVCPSMSNTASVKTADPTDMTGEEWNRLVEKDVFSKPFNFSGVPTLCVPSGFSSEGLPMSVQFIGRRLSEATICRVGHAYQQVTKWHTMHPPV